MPDGTPPPALLVVRSFAPHLVGRSAPAVWVSLAWSTVSSSQGEPRSPHVEHLNFAG